MSLLLSQAMFSVPKVSLWFCFQVRNNAEEIVTAQRKIVIFGTESKVFTVTRLFTCRQNVTSGSK